MNTVATAQAADAASNIPTANGATILNTHSHGASIDLTSTVSDTENHTATFSLSVTDSSSGEEITDVSISGAPTGTRLSIDGTLLHADGQGVFHLTAVQAASTSISILPPSNFTGEITLSVSATAHGPGTQYVTTFKDLVIDVTDTLSQTESALSTATAQSAVTGSWHINDAAGLHVTPIATADHGNVTINADGTYTYQSNSHYVGTDTIKFTATDGSGVVHTNYSTVTVTDALTQTETNPSSVTTHQAVTGSWSTTDAAGLTETPTAVAANGDVTVNADGTYTYQSHSGFVGADTITFQTTDASGVVHTNTAQVTVADALTQSETGGAGTAQAHITGSCGATDAAGLTETPTASAANGDVTVNADGTYTYQSHSGFVGADTITFQTTDASGVVHTNTAQVTVADHASIHAGNATGSLATSYGGTLTVHDSAGESLSTTASSDHGGTVNISADGHSYSYTAASGFVGSDTIHFTTTDASGVVHTATAAVTVSDAISETASNATATAQTSSQILTGHVDVTDSAGLSYNATGTSQSGAQVSVSADGSYSYTAAAGFVGTDTVTFSATDTHGVVQAATATITVSDVITDTAGDTAGDNVSVITGTFISSDAGGLDSASTLATNTVATADSGATVNVDANGHYSYTAVAGFVGTDTITFETTDSSGVVGTATATVIVTDASAGAGVDVLSSVAVNAKGSLSTSFTGLFSAHDSLGESITSIGTAGHGTVSLDGNGHYAYTAAAGFVGTDTLTFTSTNADGVVTTATAFVTVSDTLSDTATGGTSTAQHAITGSVTVTESADLSFTTHASAGHGTVSLGTNGSYTYVSNSGFVGTDTVTFTTTDAHGVIATATSQIVVTDSLSSSADNATGSLASGFTGTYAISDTASLSSTTSGTAGHGTVSVDGSGHYAYTAASGFVGTDTVTFVTTNAEGDHATTTAHVTVSDTLTESATGGTAVGQNPITGTVTVSDSAGLATSTGASAAHGAVTFGTNGAFTYESNSGFVGTDTVTFTTTDSHGVIAAATAAMVITDTITDTAGNATGTSTGSATTLTGSFQSTDAAGADTATVLDADTHATASHGTVTVNADGTYTYVSNSGYVGTDTITFSTTDSHGTTAHTTATVVVNAAATTGETIQAPSSLTTTENHSSSFTLNMVDASSNAANDTLTNVSITGAPSGTTLVVGGVTIPQNADGSFTLATDQVSNESVTVTPPTDYTGTMSLTIAATTDDGTGTLTTNTSVTALNVTAQTQGAIIVAPTSLSGTENYTTSFTLGVSDSHLNESVTGVTITGAPLGSSLTVGGETIVANADGSFTLSASQAADGSLAITPPTDYSGAMTLTVHATAQEIGATAATATQTITLTVGADTQGATITAPTTVTGAENSASTLSLNIADTHTGESVSSVTIMGAPSGSSLNVNGVVIAANADGSFTLTPAQANSGAVHLTPPTDYSGSMSLLVEATAQNGTATAVTSTQAITFDVTPVTQGATITAPATATMVENQSSSIALNVSDTHLHESVTGVTITGAPAGSSLTVGSDVVTANADGSFTLTPQQAASTSLHLTPPTDYTGAITLNVAATADATGAASTTTTTQTITVDVTGITQGATIVAPQAVGGISNSSTPFTLNVSDGHLGESVTTVTIAGAPSGTTLSVNGQAISANADGSFTLTAAQAADAGLAITPPANYVGTMNLTVAATADLTGAAPVTTSQTVSLNITAAAANGATIAGPSTAVTTENQAASVSLNVADSHTGESVSSVTIAGAPAGSILTVGGTTLIADGSGTFHLTATQASNATLSITPPTDYSGTMHLTVSATAVTGTGTTETNTHALDLTVTAVTQGASVSVPASLVTHENAATLVPLTIADTHTGESVTGVTITGAPSGSVLTVGGTAIVADASGAFHLTAAQANDSSLSIKPPTDYSGTMALHVNAVSENGSAATLTASQALNITVDPITQGATVTAPTTVAITENHAAAIPITVADTHTGESISSVTISGAPVGSTLTVGTLTLSPDSTGTFNLTPAQAASATLSLNPPKDYSGPIVLEIDATAVNGSAAPVTTTQTIDVSVNGVVQGATIIAPASVTDTQNHAASISLQVSDSHTSENVSAVSITGAPSGSTLSVSGQIIAQNADGSFTLTPTQAASASLSLVPPTDYSGTMTLHVNATASMANATDAIASQTITVSVGAVTQGAAISAPQAVGMFTGGTSQFSLNITDTHSHESVTAVTITGAPSGSTLTLAGHTLTASNGTFTLSAAQVTALSSGSETLTVKPPSSYSGLFTLHVNATTDATGAAAVTTTQNIAVDVSSTTSSHHHGFSSSGPQIASLGGTLTDAENHSTSFVLNTTDTSNSFFGSASVNSVTISGAPVGTTMVVDGVTMTGTTVTSGGHSTVTFTVPSGHYANGTVQITPPTDYYGTMSLTVTAKDTANASATQTITLNVTETSQGATITTTPNSVNDTPNSPATVALHVTDSHVGETVSAVTISGAPSGSTLTVGGATVTANAAGVFSLTAEQVAAAQTAGGDTLLITPPHNYTGIMYLQVNATVLNAAGGTETNTQVVPINVAQPTIGATITAPSTVTASENHSTSFSLNVADSHLGESVSTVTITGAPNGTYLSVDGHYIHAYNSTFTLTAAQASNATLTIHPPHDYNGAMSLVVHATAVNSQGVTETNTQTIGVSFGGVTQGATIEVPWGHTITAQENHAISLNAEINDGHGGESITAASIGGAPAGSTLTIGGTILHQDASGAFALTPAQAANGNFILTTPTGYVGEVTLTISATAQNGSAAAVTSSQNLVINVQDVGPTASQSHCFSVNTGGIVTESIGATGAAGNTLSYALESGEGPSHGSVTFDQNGNFTYSANSGYSGTDQFQVVVSDGHGGTVVQTETVNVINPFTQEYGDGFHNANAHWNDGVSGHVFRNAGDVNATLNAGNGNNVIYGNDGSDATGAHTVTMQLHITAHVPDEAYGATMSYSLGNLPSHTSIVDASGNALDACHLTNAQISGGIYLSCPDNHIASSFDLSVTATATNHDGSTNVSTGTLAVDSTAFGGNDVITAGSGNNTIYGGVGNNLITAGDGNNTVYVEDGNNTISLGHGNDTIHAGDGNNTITLGEGSVTLGDGNNSVTFDGGTAANPYALTGTVSLGEGSNLIHISGSGSNENITILDNTHAIGTETLTLQHTGTGSGGDTMLFDFNGHAMVLNGDTGGNWTDTLDLSKHAQAGDSLYVVDNQGHTISIGAGEHGTINLTDGSGSLSNSGHVFTDSAHQHQAVEFHNIEKITY